MKKYLRLGLVAGLLCCSFMTGCASSSNDSTTNPSTDTDNGTGQTTTSYFSGTWVTNVASTALDSYANIEKTVAACKKYGINNIFVVVWNKGQTVYPSAVMKSTFGVEQNPAYTGRDPLAEIITVAHKNGIKVHAWFEYGFACSYNAQGGTIIAKKPNWAAKDVNGNLVNKNGFDWMNPFLPEVQDFMISLFTEVVKNYDVDGVQGDDRMPALPSTGGYDDYTVNLYKQEHNNSAPPTSYNNTDWINWRTDKLTSFLGRLYNAVKAVKSSVMVTSAPSIYSWGKTEYLQDWPSWLNKGYIDMVIPQIYRYDISNYKSTLMQQLSNVSAANKKKFVPGMLIKNGDYYASDSFLQQMIEANRSNSISGECFWFYEGLSHFDSYFQNYKK